ncbi:FAD/NAD(P)-binding domain-containing protein [Hyaloscypha variabilis F]|uniref:FAD/NAD(P)-binding domain-containing protein n=1 Tax=Hyaloscypha variabilis (strain UAMH 11265 / GT02V1 / F) TaxID=1149755 RepID=A0A2J6RU11_HYAVF|nr:FAD/NAD(P)-binding domain-containing protein [Hyaloscypha variabilis F]
MGGGEHPPTKILIIGGSYAGLAATTTLLDLSRGLTSTGTLPSPTTTDAHPKLPISITLVDERDGFYHTIGSPLALASTPYSHKAWMKFSSLPALQVSSLKFIQGSVKSIDSESKTAKIDGKEGESDEKYDFLIAASGLRRVFPVVPQSLTEGEYLEEARVQIERIEEGSEGVVVIGAVGTEMAAEIKHVHPTKTVKLIHSRSKLLSSEPLPDDLKDTTLSLLREAGVEVLLNRRVASATSTESHDGQKVYKVTLSNGETFQASTVIWALSKAIPTTTYLPPSSLTADSLVKVQPTLSIPSIPNLNSHFAAGDLVAWSGIKRCGSAMAMGNTAAFNIYQTMIQEKTGKKAESMLFPEVPPMITLAVGGKAVSYSPGAGMEEGEEVMRSFFGSDLGLEICYDHLRLGVEPGLPGK